MKWRISSRSADPAGERAAHSSCASSRPNLTLGQMAWASLAASVLLAAAIGGYLVSRPDVGGGTTMAEAVVVQEGEFAGSGIEVMTPIDADVYDLTVGDTQIVMIFDERFDI